MWNIKSFKKKCPNFLLIKMYPYVKLRILNALLRRTRLGNGASLAEGYPLQ